MPRPHRRRVAVAAAEAGEHLRGTHEKPGSVLIMSHGEVHDTRRYWVVFGALAALTVLTVGVSYLHLPMGMAIAVALVIASVKGGLVAAYFMHLVSERTIIFLILGITAIVSLGFLVPIFDVATHVHVP